MKIRVLICLVVVSFLLGCATYGNKNIKDDELISKIQPDITTKEEVKQLIGDPWKVSFTESGEETWDYMLTKSQARASSFIPIVGIFAGGVDTQTYTLTIRIGKDGIVKGVGKGSSTGGAGSVFD